ncbi:hypothetical protein CFOL_v3_18221 [Cephalotus follicularis]|uniref:UBN2_3 domain-containing protein n=1 Tax=Cephalotus follicularis TaxID=3775 RepID=A0A1Q3C3N1_CEPFO|nr:hypothetical protein CFOL_v3_18221 [Cephalotus follicularis]
MATMNIIADLNKGEKLTGTDYVIWHKKMTFLLNEQELYEHLTITLTRAPEENTTQHRRDIEVFEACSKKDRCERFTLLSCMHEDLLVLMSTAPQPRKCGTSSGLILGNFCY